MALYKCCYYYYYYYKSLTVCTGDWHYSVFQYTAVLYFVIYLVYLNFMLSFFLSHSELCVVVNVFVGWSAGAHTTNMWSKYSSHAGNSGTACVKEPVNVVCGCDCGWAVQAWCMLIVKDHSCCDWWSRSLVLTKRICCWCPVCLPSLNDEIRRTV